MSDLVLETPIVEIENDPVADFCAAVLSRHLQQWPVSEETLADEVLAFSRLSSLPGLEGVSGVCQDRLQISVSFVALPDGMRGYNGSYGSRREILISTNQDFAGAKLHTLLHELREVLESEFERQGRPTANHTNVDLEERAESFAIAVQVRAANAALPGFLEMASTIERRWLRIGAYIFLFIGAIAYVLGCASLQQVESAFAAQRRGQHTP